jgi:hypothetical protein
MIIRSKARKQLIKNEMDFLKINCFVKRHYQCRCGDPMPIIPVMEEVGIGRIAIQW